VEVVSRILRHARVSITLDIYRHVLDAEKEQSMPDLFDKPLPKREGKAVKLSPQKLCCTWVAHESSIKIASYFRSKRLEFCYPAQFFLWWSLTDSN
jgi:hypothetical protein